jgi:hypothetical protein
VRFIGERAEKLRGFEKYFSALSTQLFLAHGDNSLVMRRAVLITASAGLAVLATTWWQAIASTRGWPATLPRHLLWYVAAGLAWMAATAVVRPTSRAQLWIVVVIAVAMRVPAWWTAPAHSDDVYRYLWDGRVQRAGVNPYRYAPDAPELTGLRDEEWARINNRQLPTIYPPSAQWIFAAAPSLPAWKLWVAMADALVALLLYIGARQRPREIRRWVAWLWSPLVVIELGVNAHVDAVGIALLVAALLAWARGRRAAAGALLGAAAMVKLLPVVALAGMRSRRALAGAAAVVVVVALPYVGAGPRLAGSLGEYGRRWRGNDGAFAVLYAAAEHLVAHTRFARRYDMASSPRLARWITGRDRDQIYPDEVANLAARVAASLVFLTAIGWALWARAPPARVAEVAIGAFALLTPALHPWYVLWLLPLFVLGGSWAWLVLATLAPLGYRPLDEWLTRGTWHDPLWTRAVEHGATLVALAIDRWLTSSMILNLEDASPRRV